MQGEFRGDFTRDTFDPHKHFLRVLMQQGRVQLDADPNEQSSILIHYLQSLAVDLMGPHAAPAEDGGFEILSTGKQVDALGLDAKQTEELKEKLEKNDFIVGKGKYYVNGILCENDGYISYFDQPAAPVPIPDTRKKTLEKGKNHLVYLDVWERHISYIQDEIFSEGNIDDPSIREVALGGPDTATRSQIVWQVKFRSVDNGIDGGNLKKDYNEFLKALGKFIDYSGRGTGKLKAIAKGSDTSSTDPCIIKPSSSYRGAENQLYRVEIHDGGSAFIENKAVQNNQATATFKWSRENSSVIFPIRKLETSSGGISPTITITLAHLGQDNRFTLVQDDWVEIVDNDYIWQNLAKPLFKIDSIDLVELKVTLSGTVDSGLGQDPQKHPYLRRWDRNKSTLEASKSPHGVQVVEEDKWILLEEGVEVCFPSAKTLNQDPLPSSYRTGDYWLIPARTATGDVEWPGSADAPIPLPPHGIVHHYAPLAIVSVSTGGPITSFDCRRKLNPQWM